MSFLASVPGHIADADVRLVVDDVAHALAVGDGRVARASAYRSKAPMSTTARPSPLPSFRRGKARWSVAGTPALSPASMHGLPASSASVFVGPPLFRKGPSRGAMGWAAVPTMSGLTPPKPVLPVPSPIRL